MNHVTISGRVAGEPKLGEKYAHFSVDTRRYDWKEKKNVANYVNVTLLGEKSVETFKNHFGRGKAVELTGELQNTSYEKDGVTKWSTNVVTQRVGFVPTDYDADGANVTATDAGADAPF